MKKVVIPLLLAVLFAALAPTFVAIALRVNPQDSGPIAFIALVCFFIAATGIGVTLTNATELRDQVPGDWNTKLDRDYVLTILGNPIPRDAVDRRWLRQIYDALLQVSTYPMQTEFMDPISIAQEQAKRDAARDLVFRLINAARDARGVRLPPKITVTED